MYNDNGSGIMFLIGIIGCLGLFFLALEHPDQSKIEEIIEFKINQENGEELLIKSVCKSNGEVRYLSNKDNKYYNKEKVKCTYEFTRPLRDIEEQKIG